VTPATPHACEMAAVELAELPGRPCPIAATLELVGERWSVLVGRELLLGANRFGEIVDGTGAPRDRLAARLKSLELVGRELLLGASRFGEIVDGTGAPRDRLAARLKSLEQMGVVTRTPYQTAPPRFECRLTPRQSPAIEHFGR
jgi:DNA-binding HxlR family transcriptional regulator